MPSVLLCRTSRPWVTKSWGGAGSSPVAAVVAACALGGCAGSLSGTAGDEGTVNLSKSEDAAKSNPNMAKAAARRLGGGMEGTPSKAR